MKYITTAVTITAKEFKNTSVNGNPSFYVWFEDENGNTFFGYTANDAACGYGVGNYINKRCNITFHYTRKGSLIIDYIIGLK